MLMRELASNIFNDTIDDIAITIAEPGVLWPRSPYLFTIRFSSHRPP